MLGKLVIELATNFSLVLYAKDKFRKSTREHTPITYVHK